MRNGNTLCSLRAWLAPALIVGLIVAIGFAGLAAPSPSASDTASPEVDHVIDMVLNRNPGLQSYQAHARLDVAQLNFPWLHPVMDGKVYYNRPGYTVYDFPHTPSYLQGITKAEGAVGIVSRWRHCYNISLEDRSDAYVLHMVPKILGEVAEMDVTIDKTNGELQHFQWTYHRHADSVTLTQHYTNIGGYDVVTSQESDITKHWIRAKATGTFDSFHYNVPAPTPTPTPSNPLHQCDN
jgi:hypothetical protein